MKSNLRRLLVFALVCLSFARPAAAAITFDATSNTDGVSASGSPSSITFNGHGVASDANYLVACITIRGDGINASAPTWNGVAMTQRASASNAGAELNAYLYDLVAPTTGNQTFAFSASGTSNLYMAATLISLKGVETSSHIDDTDSTTSTAANPTLPALTTVTDGAAVIDCVASNTSGAPTMNAETNRVQRASFNADTQERGVGASTIITKSPAGSVTMGWNIGSNESAYVAIAVKPAAGGGGGGTPNNRTQLLMGVGR